MRNKQATALSHQPSVLFLAPQGLPEMTAHHEATSGMGALLEGPAPFAYPPHVIATCAATARVAGLSVTVLDAGAGPARIGPGVRPALSAVLAQVVSHPAEIVAVNTSQGTADADGNFLRLLRQLGPQRRVLLFGPSAHLVAEPWLASGLADAVLLGEPEAAITGAIIALAAGERQGAIPANTVCPGLYDASGWLTDLDRVPLPAWDLVPWRAYGEAVSLLSSRGCPAGCRYCAYVVMQGHRVRSQSVERTLAELEWLAREIKPAVVTFRDPVFAYDRDRIEALCAGIQRRRIVLRWACESRPEHFDAALLRLMRQAGCMTVKIGMESGDPALLRTLGRLTDAQTGEAYLAQVDRVAVACQELGLDCRVFVMVGLPGQGAASVACTMAALRRLARGATIHPMSYQPHPGAGMTGPAAVVPPEMLTGLRRANQWRPTPWQRVRHLLARRWRRLRWIGRRQGDHHRTEAVIPSGSAAQFPLQRASSEESPFRTPRDHLLRNSSSSVQSVASLSGRRVFLTGGTGFVGGYVARALVAAGVQIVALVRSGSPLGALAELADGVVEFVVGDLISPRLDWAEALSGCDYCFHVAALYGGPDCTERMYAVNVSGTSALLAACASAGVRRIVYTGTIGTVGRPAAPAEPADESRPFNLWDSASPYIRSKYLGELVARTWSDSLPHPIGQAGLEVVLVKPGAPVGAGDARPTATGSRILAALRGEITAYPPGGVNHVPVRDVAAGHLLAALHGLPGRVYILAHRAGNLDHAGFLQMVAQAADTVVLRPPAPSAIGGQLPVALTADPTRAIQELGLPQSDLGAAFAEAVAWYRAHKYVG